MPRVFPYVALILPAMLLGFLTGCTKADIQNNEAVRAAILRHLEARGDLGMENLDIQIVSTKFDGDSSEAEVRFQPKGQPPESGMTMHYKLLRDGDTWKVQPRPDAGHAMPLSPGAPAPPTATPNPTMPPGHPPVGSTPRQ